MRSAHFALFLSLFSVTVLAALFYSRLPADDPETYFQFADQTARMGIANFNDVVSNLAFAFVGIYGLRAISRGRPAFQGARTIGWIFAGGCLLTAAGSAYFHLKPNPQTLFWDRLPMTVIFSAIFAMTVTDRVGRKEGQAALAAALLFGLFSTVGWTAGLLSLRPYIIMQFGGIAAILILILLRREGGLPSRALLITFLLYGAAKACETYDDGIFSLTFETLSGHTLKHLLAAAAVAALMRSYIHAFFIYSDSK